MGIKEQLQADMVVAMKAKEKERLDAVRLLKAAIQRFELDRTDRTNADYGKPVTEDDLLGLVSKQIKQRRDAIDLYVKGGRQELADKEAFEISVFEQYLPTQLGREEVASEVAAIIAREGKDFKKVMPLAAKELKGRADGRMVSEVVKELTA